MSPNDYHSYLRRESEIFAKYGYQSIRAMNQPKPWNYVPGFDPTGGSNTKSGKKSYQRYVPSYMFHVAWDLSPVPLSMTEERNILKRRRWQKLKGIPFGDYKVAPERYDVQWIQRIFWAAREIRGVTRLISLCPSKHFINDLRQIRNLINSLSPGNGQVSDLQRKLTSDVYYCLRQCSRLQDDEESLSETRA
jgi:hypothetical protein